MDFGVWQDWLVNGWETWPWALISFFGAYVWLLVLIRIRGLRSLSKMTAGDFVTTVALGTILASAVTTANPSLTLVAIAMTSVFLVHGAVAKLRARFDWFREVVGNDPIVLMRGPEVIHENLSQASLSMTDLRCKLREANVVSREQIKMVILEQTGDVSVLHSDDTELDSWIFEDVADD